MKAKHARSSQSVLYLVLLVISCILVVVGSFIYQAINKKDPDTDETDSPVVVTTTASTTTSTTIPTTATTLPVPQDGLTPHIGENGNWWIGETDTGVKAAGTDSQNGITPHIGENGNWWIGETDTGVKAAGTDGQNGITPHIGENGNWWIGETDTGVKAAGADGQNGITPHIGENGNWWIGETDTGVLAGTAATTTTTIAVTTTTTVPTTKPSTSATSAPTAASGTIAFDDTLFIGDSRTQGLSLYGKITNADFFAYQSFNSFSILKKTLNIKGVGEVTLEQLLSKKTYKTIYIMLGINEIGYSMDSIVKQYTTILNTVKAKQPDATIILQSTLHVRADKQVSSKGITNDRINTLNTHLAAMADNVTVFYLDVNPVFDNNGAMDKQYSNDGVHFYSKYYPLWRDFLANNRP